MTKSYCFACNTTPLEPHRDTCPSWGRGLNDALDSGMPDRRFLEHPCQRCGTPIPDPPPGAGWTTGDDFCPRCYEAITVEACTRSFPTPVVDR